MENNLVVALALNKNVRIYCADTTDLCEQARLTHDLYPTSAAALGRLLSVTALMGQMLKDDNGKITTTINGKGPIGTCMATSYNNGIVKGFVGDNKIYLKYNESEKLAVGLAVGTDGYLKVTKSGKKTNFTGNVKLVSGEIGDDFAYYFMQSEQVPSIVSLGVLVNTDYSIKAAGALIIQLMPGHSEEDIVYLENLLKTLKPISSLIEEGKTPKQIIDELFLDASVEAQTTLKYHCDCEKQRFAAALTTLPLDDLKDLAKEEEIELKCEYCNKFYKFNSKELGSIIEYVENKRLGN